MNPKSLLFLILLFFSFHIFAQDLIYTEIVGDTVIIHHDETERNCASLYEIDFNIEDNLISLYEIDTAGQLAFCVCHFDLSAKISGLEPGNYFVDVFSAEGGPPNFPDTLFWGSTSFTIEDSGSGYPQISNSIQSDCYTPCPPPEGVKLEVECFDFIISVENEDESLYGYNIYLDGILLGFISSVPYYSGTISPGLREICISAVCTEGESEPVCFEVNIPYGDPPQNFEAYGTNEGSVQLNWESPDGLAESLLGYHVFRNFEVLNTTPIDDTSYLDPEIEINTLYQYYVAAIYDDCVSLSTDTIDIYWIGSVIEDKALIDLDIYPIPAKDFLALSSNGIITEVRFYNLLGNTIFESQLEQSKVCVDVIDIPSGLYFINLIINKHSITRKILIE
jgi:hypothetical protein